MASEIYLKGTTPEQLVELINQGVKTQLSDLKKELNITNDDQLLTPQEVCKLLQIDASTLWHWRKKGKVSCLGIGSRRYYKKSDLLNALKPLKQ